MPEFSGIFDFIDYLESQNPVSGTANENRAFVFANVLDAIKSALIPEEVYSAFLSVGISIPENTFNSIIDLRIDHPGEGNIIQILAPTSLIPSFALPEYTGKFLPDEDFITYYDVTYIEPNTGDVLTKQGQYLKYNDEFTPSELSATMAKDFATRYKAQVLSVKMLRSYQTLTA